MTSVSLRVYVHVTHEGEPCITRGKIVVCVCVCVSTIKCTVADFVFQFAVVA